MSGAEALVALGLAANVLQFVEFATELCDRIRDYSTGPGMPKKLASQADRLSDLLIILRSLSQPAKGDPLREQVLQRCQVQAEDLALLLDSLRGSPKDQNRWWKNAKKALQSLSRAEKIEEIEKILNSLLTMLSIHLQAQTRDASDRAAATTASILQSQDAQLAILADLRLDQLKKNTKRTDPLLDQPAWVVPIGRNPEFVGRKSIIQEIGKRLEPSSDFVRKAVLCGLGGVGKSQIALEYAYQQKNDSRKSSIFWIHATNTARFLESFKKIATECEIPGRESPEVDVLQLVRDYLETRYECRWLMVVDNVDDRGMFFEDDRYKGKALCEYMPQTALGAILYTTRNRDIGIDLDIGQDPIDVPSMDVDDARSLLGERIRAQSSESEQLELLEELVYLPLAITQAVAFMLKRRKSVLRYLESYRQSESTRTKLLGQRFLYHGRETRSLESVATTWWVSFNSIKSENPRAAELLSIMSFMDRQGVPDSLLILDDEDSFVFDEAIGLLNAFSLINRGSSDTSNIHRLVQVATRAWLSEYENKHSPSAQEAQRLLAERFPEGWYENWNICALYLPHADVVLKHNFVDSNEAQDAARAVLLLNTASYLRRQGRLEDAEVRSAESREISERLYGAGDARTLAAMAEYAMTIHKRGRYDEAVRLQRRVLKGREEVLGHNHRLTLESLNALGYDLRSLGKYKEAEDIHRRELIEKQKLLDMDPDDFGLQSDLLIAINNAARLLSHQGKYCEAERMHREALVKTENINGFLHPDTFITLGELAGVLRDQDKLEEAQETYERLLKARIQVLGELHPDTLITRSNIATLRGRQGDHEEAARLYQQVYNDEVKLLGRTHPSTLNSLHNLGCVFADQGRTEEAEETFRKVIDLQKVVLGISHPDVLKSRRNLSVLLSQTNKYAEAESLDRETIELFRSRGEEDDSEYVQHLASFATLLLDQEKFAEAEDLRRQELAIRIRAFGEDHLDVFKNRHSLAYILDRQGRSQEAIDLYEKVIRYRFENLGWDHEDTQMSLWNQSITYLEAKRHEEAEKGFARLVQLKSEKFGAGDVETLRCLVQLAWVQQQQKKYPESESSYRSLLEAQKRLTGAEHSMALLVTNNLASVLGYQGKNEEAEGLFRFTYNTRKKLLGAGDPLTVRSLRILTEFLHEAGKDEEAKVLAEQLIASEEEAGAVAEDIS